jgi:dTMP kinase
MAVTVVPAVAMGRLITIEGLDGAGKSTLAEGLVRELRGVFEARPPDARKGFDAHPGRAHPRRLGRIELLREPGGVALSERVRELVKDPALNAGARAEALLYAAARAQLVEELLTPLLAQGACVILDRFVDSSLAYQGAGRSLGVEQIRAINLFATGGLTPDRTLLLRVDPATGRERQCARVHEPDRLEREGEGFFEAIARAYDELASAEPRRIRVIDAEAPPQEVLDEALAAVEDLF